MSVDPSTLESFTGKNVVLHRLVDGTVQELEGKVESASAVGVAFKEKGKRDIELVMPSDVENIDVAPDKPKSLAQKKLKLVTEKNVRQHLLDRHGDSRKAVSAESDEDALARHEAIDHSDLGHKHVAEEEKKEDEAGDDAA